MLRLLRGALPLWLLLALVLALVSVSRGEQQPRIDYEWRGVPVEALSQWPTFRVQLGHSVFSNGASHGSIVDAAEASSSPSLLDTFTAWFQNVVDGVSKGFWSFVELLERFSRTRHEFYSRMLNHILNIPARSPIRFGSPFGNSGATEPLAARIPEPPTISHRSGLKTEVSIIMAHVLRDYLDTPPNVPDTMSCGDFLNGELQVLREKLSSHLGALCGASPKGACTQKFCKFYNDNGDIATDMIFSKLKVDPVEVIMGRTSFAHNMKCRKTIGGVLQARHLGNLFRRNVMTMLSQMRIPSRKEESHNVNKLVEMAKANLDQLCENPRCPEMRQACWLRENHKELFESVFFSSFQPWEIAAGLPRRPLSYRRAMLFRDMSREQYMFVDIQLFKNGVLSRELHIEPLKFVVFQDGEHHVHHHHHHQHRQEAMEHQADALQKAISIGQEEEETQPLIKMNTENRGAVAI